MKQRILISGLSLLLTFSLAGCGGQLAQQEPQEPDQAKVQQSEPASTTPQFESMEVKNENDTAMPLADLEDIEPEEADGAGIFEGSGSVEVELFTEVNETVYATGTVNIRASYTADSDKLGSLSAGESVTRTGIAIEGTEAEGWSRVVLFDGTTAYISKNYLATTKPVQQQQNSQAQGSQQTQQTQSGESQQQTQQTQQPTSSTQKIDGHDDLGDYVLNGKGGKYYPALNITLPVSYNGQTHEGIDFSQSPDYKTGNMTGEQHAESWNGVSMGN